MDGWRQRRVLVIGSAHHDVILSVPALPVAGETVLSYGLLRSFGGKGANQAVAAAMAGAAVSFAGMVGADAAGEQIEQNLVAHGIDTALMRRSAGELSGLAVVVVDEGGRNLIVVAPESAAHFPEDLVHLALDDIVVDDVVVLQCEIPAPIIEAVLVAASARGAVVILNLAPFTELERTALELASIVVVNESEAAELAATRRLAFDGRDGAISLAASLGTHVVVTLGSHGSILAAPDGGVVVVPAERVEDVVDTTGAGDTYVGTLAAAIARGESTPDAVRGASVAAAAAVSRRGAQPSPPNGLVAAGS